VCAVYFAKEILMKKLLLVLIAFFTFSGMAMAAVNLNTASKAELDSVKGIGPKKAEAIIEYRKKNGSFKTVDDLKNVKGFGDKSVANIRSELTVDGAAPSKADKKAEAKADKKAEAKADKKAEAKPDAAKAAEAKKEDKPAKGDKKSAKTDAKAETKAETKDAKSDKK
jgi:competence protein ComEA